MAIRLGFAVAAFLDPSVLLLDEILSVGDADFRERCFDRIETIRHRGTALILVSHNDANIARFCDRALYLDQGLVKNIGQTDEILRQYRQDGARRNAAAGIVSEGVGSDFSSADVRVTDAYLADGNGDRAVVVDAGQAVSVRIAYRIDCPEEVEPVFAVEIRDVHGMVFNVDNEMSGVSFGVRRGAGEVELALDGLHLSNRDVDISVALHDRGKRRMFQYFKIGRVRVRNSSPTGGRDYIPHRWKALTAP